MKILDRVSTIYKLVILLIVAVIALGLMVFTAFMQLERMKYHIDTIYFGSYIPVSNLQQMMNTYHTDIFEAVYKSQEGLMSPMEAAGILRQSQAAIESYWHDYRGRYKRQDEIALVNQVHEQVKNSEEWLQQIIKAYDSREQKLIQSISIPALLSRIETVNGALQKVINHEAASARHQKVAYNHEYDNTLIIVSAIALISLALLLGIAWPISRNIRQNQEHLQETMQKLTFANKSLKEMSIVDPLTRLYNRRYFNAVMDKELKKAIREKRHFCFFMMDVDCFKMYNDTYGHAMGDEVLKEVANAIREGLKRPEDYAFRLGGEEFGGIIAGADPSVAQELTEGVLKKLEGKQIAHKKNTASAYVTASLGAVTLVPDHNSEAEAIIEEADQLLYQAKESGRNRVIIQQFGR